MSPIILIGSLVGWAGYTVVWVGGLMLRGYSGPGRPQGPGVLDLILPSRAPGLSATLKAGAPGAGSNIAPGSTVNPGGTVNPPAGSGPVTVNPNTGQIGSPNGGNAPGFTPTGPGSGPGGIGSIFAPGLQ